MQPIDSHTRTIIRDMRAEDRDPVVGILTGSDPWKRLGFNAADWNRIFAPLPAGRDTFVLEIHVESLTFARANNMFACVSDFNETARAFYRKQGYKEIGPMPNFLVPGYAEILLRKTNGPARKS